MSGVAGQACFTFRVDLAALIKKRMRETGDTFRSMEARASAAGRPISRSALNSYANGATRQHPDEERVAALVAALDLEKTPEVVAAAVHESFGVDTGDTVATGRTIQQASAWLRLTAGRTEEEVERLLAAAEAIIKLEEEWERRRRNDEPAG